MPGLFWRRERHCLSVSRPERKPGVAIQRGRSRSSKEKNYHNLITVKSLKFVGPFFMDC